MPLDQEPPDGDYAAYIDRLVNGRQGAPGAVEKSHARGTRRLPTASRREGKPVASGDASPSNSAPPTRGTRAGAPPVLVRRDHNSHTEFEYVAPENEPGKEDSLGPRGSSRLAGIVQIILGLGALALFARVASHMTYSHDPFSLDHLVPLVLLGFIARMFLTRGNARLREARSGRTAPGPTKSLRRPRLPSQR